MTVEGRRIVSHLENDLVAIHLQLLSVAVLDGGVVALYPHVLHELRGETALAHTTLCSLAPDAAAIRKQPTSAQDHDMILSPVGQSISFRALMIHLPSITHLGEATPGLLMLANLSWTLILSQETICGTFPCVCVSVPMPYTCRGIRVAGFEKDACEVTPQARQLDTFVQAWVSHRCCVYRWWFFLPKFDSFRA